MNKDKNFGDITKFNIILVNFLINSIKKLFLTLSLSVSTAKLACVSAILSILSSIFLASSALSELKSKLSLISLANSESICTGKLPQVLSSTIPLVLLLTSLRYQLMLGYQM